MDLEGPGRDVQVGRQSPCPEEFRTDAVALHRAAGGKRTYAAAAAEQALGGKGAKLLTGRRIHNAWRRTHGRGTR
jgi:transposase